MSALVHPDVRGYRMTVRLDASTAEPHVAGWIYVWGTAAMVGVLDYSGEFGTRELRDEVETFDPASMHTLWGCPLTLDHPDPSVNEGLVTTSTVRELVHGWVLDVQRDGNDLRVQVCLASDEALDAYDSGIRELSCGYRSRYVPEPGEWTDAEGIAHAYTGRQTLIRYNHLALVPQARAGHNARLDSARGTMLKITLRNTTRDVPKFIADSIAAQAAAHEASVKAGTVRRDAIETEEVTIAGTTMILPKAMVDALLAALGVGAAPAAAATEAQTSTEAQTASADQATTTEQKPEEQPRMDAKTQKMIDEAVAKAIATALPKAINTEVGSQVGARFDAIATRERVIRFATPLLDRAYDFVGAKDEHQIAGDALVRLDAKAKDDVERLIAAARGGDLRAAGRLEQRLEDAHRSHQDAASHGAGFGLEIDAARRAEGEETTRKDSEDLIGTAKQRMLDRLHGRKPNDGKAA